MRKFTTLLFVASFMLLAIQSMAQYPSVTFLGGGNMATTDMKFGSVNTDIEDSYKPLYGLNIGALYQYVLNKDKSQEIAVEGGLLFETKGFHQKLEASKNKTTLYFLDVPVYLEYIHRFRSLNKVYIGVGGFAGMGLFGNESITPESIDASNSIKWGSEGKYERLDYGVSAKCGFLMDSGINIGVSYDYGFADIATLESQEAKTRTLRLSLGYTIRLDN